MKSYLGKDIEMSDWLSFMKKKPEDVLFEYYCFPNETIKNSFISNIQDYNESDVMMILHNFLDFGGLLGSDRLNLESFMQLLKDDKDKATELISKNPYYRRMFKVIQTKGKIPLYDSVAWSLDLLPESPRDALNVINAFLTIHIGHLPDGRIHGLSDAEAIIRAKYFDAETDKSVLYSLTPDEFEYTVEALYYEMGYETAMTKRSHDKGRDIIAKITQVGRKEHLVISCKRLKDNVAPADYREIMSSVDRERASKGVVVTTSGFSTQAIKEATESPRMDLIDQPSLQKMLNEFFGANWSAHLDYYISASKMRHPDDKRIN